jgi:hypothetical protein
LTFAAHIAANNDHGTLGGLPLSRRQRTEGVQVRKILMAGIAMFGASQACAASLEDNKFVQQAATTLLAVTYCGNDKTAALALAKSLVNSAMKDAGVDNDTVVDAVQQSMIRLAQDNLLFHKDHTEWCNKVPKPCGTSQFGTSPCVE